MDDKPLKISERIEPTLIPALFKNFDNPEIALLELIDNAVDDRVEGRTLEISIEIDSKSINITNKGGGGMGFDELDSFFAWGRSNKKGIVGHLGRYGQGGKAAMGYLAKSCQIVTTKMGEDREFVVEIENWGERENGYVNAEVVERDSDEIEQGLVKFKLWNLHKRFSSITSLAKTLSETYAPLLRSKKIKMWLNYTEILGFKIPYQDNPKKIELELIPGKGKCVHADIGLIKYKKGLRGGFRCYEFGRLITKGEYFGQKTREDKYAFEKLTGEVFIDFDILLIMNKTNFDRGSEYWQTLESLMYSYLEPWIRKLSGSRKDPSKVELVHQRNINARLEDFRISQLEKVRDNLRKNKSDDEKSIYDDLIPNYIVEFRSLDKNLRYLLVTENNQKKILINLSFPPYKTWQRDMDLYIVNILVQELARQQSENIEEFMRRFNQIFIDISKSFKK